MGEGGRLTISNTAWLTTVARDVMGWSLVILTLIAALKLCIRRAGVPRIAMLYLWYVAATLLTSLVVSLKEPRYVIFLVPIASILVATAIDWGAPATGTHARAWTLALALVALVGAWDLSPLRLVPADEPGPRRWLDPVFASRAIDSDLYYGVLAQAGRYLASKTSLDTEIAVVNEGPVVGYYADRHYTLLYTLPMADAIQTLANSEYLVYDREVFLQQTEAEIARVVDYIERNFGVERVFEDSVRRVVVYRRRLT
jgi:hypothetical protein